MTALSNDPGALARTLLDEHTGDENIDSLLLSAAKAIECLEGEIKTLRRRLRRMLCDCNDPTLPANTHYFSCPYRAFLREARLRGDTALQWEDE